MNESLHLNVDFINGAYKWYNGESEKLNMLNGGVNGDVLRVQRRPGSGINAAMRSLTLGCLWLLTACGPAQISAGKAERRQHQWSPVSCRWTNAFVARKTCVGTSATASSTARARRAPARRAPVRARLPPSRLHFACTDDGGKPLISLGSDSPPADATDKKPPPARSCATGESAVCVGAAACKGGQACLADGSGFGPCDCGPVRPRYRHLRPARQRLPDASAPPLRRRRRLKFRVAALAFECCRAAHSCSCTPQAHSMRVWPSRKRIALINFNRFDSPQKQPL